MTTHNVDTLKNTLDSLDRQIADLEIKLWDAVVLKNDDELIKEYGASLHHLRVNRIRIAHSYSIAVGARNGT